ncbi:hypothetical protein BDZ89DRAFT_1150385 [Hymenopellis radicata]|nr:hypothetical protein BDZ89DRAFT_1150385 [Hymenopellis radicata]
MPKPRAKADARRNPYRKARSTKFKDDDVTDSVVVGTNTKGLPSLPLEMHIEILSHLSSQPVPCIKMVELGHRDRFNATGALSRTCRALYAVYNPLFWRNVEARGWRRREFSTYPSDWSSYVALDLRAYARVLTVQASRLAEFVQ